MQETIYSEKVLKKLSILLTWLLFNLKWVKNVIRRQLRQICLICFYLRSYLSEMDNETIKQVFFLQKHLKIVFVRRFSNFMC
jgi:hypothetical protein